MNKESVEDFDILKEILVKVAIQNSINKSKFFNKWDVENDKHDWAMDYSVSWQSDFRESLNRIHEKITILNNFDIETVSSAELSSELFITKQHCMALHSFFDDLMEDLEKITSIINVPDVSE